MKDSQNAEYYLKRFQSAFKDKITSGRTATSEEILQWFHTANPFKRKEDLAHIRQGLVLAGLRGSSATSRSPSWADSTATQEFVFKKNNTLWQLAFDGSTVTLPEVKGFGDLARLLAAAGKEIHCLEIMGGYGGAGGFEPVLDQKARLAYGQRIRELRSEIDAAEAMNDLFRREKSSDELDRLTEHLARALGVGRRDRQLNATVERARTAVTWRIRSAIKKIEAAHPTLGRHLANSIRTGVFCSYTPEKEIVWVL